MVQPVCRSRSRRATAAFGTSKRLVSAFFEKRLLSEFSARGSREKHFNAVGGAWQVAPQLQEKIRWSTANLTVGGDVARMLPASVVFCRNVFIYFSADAIARTVRLFAEGMNKPGYLFVGVSESLIRHTSDFELREIAGTFVYCRS